MTKAVVFDLDGTLADTADLVSGNRRREPAHVLALSPPGEGIRNLRFDDERERIPGDLAALGYRVAIVTASRADYASTLADLLNIDFERLLTVGSAHERLAEKIRLLATDWDINPIDMCYVGDRHQEPNSDDKDAAYEFIPAEKIAILRNWPRITNSRSTPDSPNPFPKPPNGPAGAAGGTRQVVDAFIGLKNDPGRQDRRELQTRFLTEVPREARDCVIDRNTWEGRFQFPPWLLSKSEIQENGELRALAMDAAARLFPVVARRPVGNAWVEGLVPFTSPYGQLLKTLKDWNKFRRPSGSGGMVRQSLGYFMALAIAGHLQPIVKQADRQILLVPMPAKPFTIQQPGEFSLRLATRVAEFLEVEIAPVLVHGRDHSAVERRGDWERWRQTGLPVVVVDDQYTTGKGMSRAVDILKSGGFEIKKLVTWSLSTNSPEFATSECYFQRHLGPSWGDCNCSHKPVVLDPISKPLSKLQKTRTQCSNCFLMMDDAVVAKTGECNQCGSPLDPLDR